MKPQWWIALKNLWKVLQKVMPDDRPREVKSLMRDAPDYESRTQYRPRHATAKPEESHPPVESGILNIVEPPISADDTRPRAPVRLDPVPVQEEPATQADSIFSKPFDDPDTGTIEPVVYPLPVEKQPDARDFVPRPPDRRVDSDYAPTPRRSTQEMKPFTPEPVPPVESTPVKPDEPVEVVPPVSPKPEPASPSATGSFDTVKMATSEMSVFELFGLPRPSQTQEINRVIISEPVQETVESPAISIKPSRVGLRLVLRRRHVNIRRPQ